MKKKTRRIISCLLAAVLAAGMVSACGAQPAPVTEAPQSTAKTTEEATKTQPVTTTENTTEALPETTPEVTTAPETTSAEPASAWPEKEVTLISTGSVGGTMDTIARIMAASFNDSWGSAPKVVAMAGDSWSAYTDLLIANNDGYTLALAVYPGLISAYAKNPQNIPQTYRDFSNIAGIIKNPYVIFVMKESSYQTLQDLVEKGKETERSIVVLNSGDIGDMLVKQINERCGTQFKSYGCATRPDMLTAMSNGAAAIAPAATLYQRGDFRVLAVLDTSPSYVFPDAPMIDQIGIAEMQGFYFQARHGLIAPANLDQTAADRIKEAVANLESDANFLTMVHNAGYDLEILSGDEYDAYLQSVEDDFREYYAGN